MATVTSYTKTQLDSLLAAKASTAAATAAALAARTKITAPIAARAFPPGSSLFAAGTYIGAETRAAHVIVNAQTEIIVRYVNDYNATGVETDAPNPVNIRVGIEYPAGTFTPVYFQGKRDGRMEGGAVLDSDPVPVQIPAGATIWSRTIMTVDSTAAQFPVWGGPDTTRGEAASLVTTSTDKSTSGTISNTVGYGYIPASIRGTRQSRTVLHLAGVGDSIIYGTGDTAVTTRGWFGMAFEGVCDVQRIAHGSERASHFAAIATRRRRIRLIEGCNVAISDYGINDIANGTTLATLQANVLSIATLFVSLGMTTFWTTITPRTASTDSFATTTNQTAQSGETVRVGFNDWLRGSAPVDPSTKAAVAVGTSGALLMGAVGHPLSGYLEVADVAESARNSGLWKVTGAANYATADGIHPSTTMHTLIAAVATAALPALTAAASAA